MSSYTKGRFIVRDIDSPSKIKKESSPKTRKVSPPKPIKKKTRFRVFTIDPALPKDNDWISFNIKKESPPKTRKESPPKPKNEIKIMGRFKVRDISPPK